MPDPSPSPEDTPLPDGLSPAQYAILLVPLILLTEVTALELTLIYPVLPLMSDAFDTPSIGWTLTVVSLTGVVAQPLLGRVADVIGKKRMMLYAAGLFAAGSLICALAPSYPVLLAGRAVQGTCLVMAPAAYGLIRDIFPARVVPVALGAVTTGIGLSAIIGPLTGGALGQAFGYRAVFWFALVYVAVLIPWFARALPESPVRRPRADWRRVDAAGGLLLGIGAGGLLLFIGQGGGWGWASAPTLATLGCSLLLLAGFVRRELRTAEPLIDLRLLTGPALRWTLVAAFSGAFAIGGTAFAMPMLVQTPTSLGYGFGMSVLGAAVFLVPQGLIGAACGPLGGLLAGRRGPRYTLMVALCGLSATTLTLALLHTALWQLLLAALFMGVGFGCFFVGVSNLVVEAVPADRTAVGAGLMGVANNLGQATGVTLLGAVLARYLVDDSDEDRILYAETGYLLAFGLASAVAFAGLMVATAMRHGRAPASGGVLRLVGAEQESGHQKSKRL
ncbi:MFS transporter [Streptomyces sp. NBC_01381]|uniref:MFS transporter n=1 Tax=Streptomyces sp. NBC_01381 TaxID=2903845 RepID=UPI0022510DA9|nr:MFS transporter [Streptomyces sp. NBC_01381]MCX4671937.1 MFS transporter [Streptomyces sp. NBC_01381]